MAQKILLATGCSFTDKDFKSLDGSLPPEQSGGWPMWPELMGDELGLKVINRGLSGRGADHMLDSIVDEIAIYGDRIDTVAVLWSSCDRWPFFDATWNPFTDLTEGLFFHGDNIKDWQDGWNVKGTMKRVWESKGFNSHVYTRMIENQLRKMCAVVDICKANNIKLIMNQGVAYFSHWCLDLLLHKGIISKNQHITKEHAAYIFMSSPMFAKLDELDNIIGWPLFNELNGTCFDVRRIDIEKTFISKKDRHPNAYGQTLLAKEFLDKYYELYE